MCEIFTLVIHVLSSPEESRRPKPIAANPLGLAGFQNHQPIRRLVSVAAMTSRQANATLTIAARDGKFPRAAVTSTAWARFQVSCTPSHVWLDSSRFMSTQTRTIALTNVFVFVSSYVCVQIKISTKKSIVTKQCKFILPRSRSLEHVPTSPREGQTLW